MANIRIENAREPEQAKRMLEAQKNGVCYLCQTYKDWKKEYSKKTFKKKDIVHVNEYWFIKKNDFPYEGSVHHYLIVSKQHITNLTKIKKRNTASLQLINAVDFLNKKFKPPGYSLFVRSGDMAYTGATLDHLHFHFLVGVDDKKSKDKIKVKLGFKK